MRYNHSDNKKRGDEKMNQKSFLKLILKTKETTKLLKTSEVIFLGLTKKGRMFYYYQFNNHFGYFTCNENFSNIRFKKV
jgi:hypothetical protein